MKDKIFLLSIYSICTHPSEQNVFNEFKYFESHETIHGIDTGKSTAFCVNGVNNSNQCACASHLLQ